MVLSVEVVVAPSPRRAILLLLVLVEDDVVVVDGLLSDGDTGKGVVVVVAVVVVVTILVVLNSGDACINFHMRKATRGFPPRLARDMMVEYVTRVGDGTGQDHPPIIVVSCCRSRWAFLIFINNLKARSSSPPSPKVAKAALHSRMEGNRRPETPEDDVVEVVAEEAADPSNAMASWRASKASSNWRSTCSALFHLTVVASTTAAAVDVEGDEDEGLPFLLLFVIFSLRVARCGDDDILGHSGEALSAEDDDDDGGTDCTIRRHVVGARCTRLEEKEEKACTKE